MKKLIKANTVRRTRRWALVAHCIRGKSTFAMKMRLPNLFVDTDHRAQESVHHAADPEQVFILPPEDTGDARKIAKALDESVPGSGIKNITVDSVTAFIKPLVNSAMLDNADGVNKNKSAAFMEKGVSMSLLQDAVSSHGTDVLWIWHKEDGNFNNQATEKETLTKTEYERLMRNLNARLEIVEGKDGMLGMEVTNLRPRPGQIVTATLWDESGSWEGMPEKIDAFLEAAATTAPTSEGSLPTAEVKPLPFKTKDDALAYAVREKFYPDLAGAEAAYNKVRTEKAPKTGAEMFRAYFDHLEALVPKAA